MDIKTGRLNAYFSKLGMKLVRDAKKPGIYLVHAPGQPPDFEPAKFMLAIPEKEKFGLQEIAALARLSQKLRKELIIPASEKPPFIFLQIRKITSW